MADVFSALGNVRLDDKAALERWLFAHELRHQAYNKHFKLPGVTLRGPMDSNWMLRHQLQHMALAKVTKDHQANLAALGNPGGWRTDQEFAVWHLAHSLMHQQIEGVMAHGR